MSASRRCCRRATQTKQKRSFGTFSRQIHELVAPDTYLVECAHALTRAERKGLLTAQEAQQKFTLISDTAPDLIQHIPLLGRAFEISSQFRVGVYDCLFVALSEREQCELVTADQKLLSTLGPHFSIVSLSSL